MNLCHYLWLLCYEKCLGIEILDPRKHIRGSWYLLPTFASSGGCINYILTNSDQGCPSHLTFANPLLCCYLTFCLFYLFTCNPIIISPSRPCSASLYLPRNFAWCHSYSPPRKYLPNDWTSIHNYSSVVKSQRSYLNNHFQIGRIEREVYILALGLPLRWVG